jgi:hypothetical protein
MGATHTIAVVVVKTDHDGTPAYIGTSHAADDTTIATEVAERGARFPLDAAAQLPNFISLIELYPSTCPPHPAMLHYQQQAQGRTQQEAGKGRPPPPTTARSVKTRNSQVHGTLAVFFARRGDPHLQQGHGVTCAASSKRNGHAATCRDMVVASEDTRRRIPLWLPRPPSARVEGTAGKPWSQTSHISYLPFPTCATIRATHY